MTHLSSDEPSLVIPNCLAFPALSQKQHSAEARHETSITGHFGLRAEAAPVSQFSEDHIGGYHSNLGNAVENGARFTCSAKCRRALAGEDALGIFRSPKLALWAQYPMLILMVLFTTGGLWVLSQK